MNPTLTNEAYEEIKGILQKQFGVIPDDFSEDLVKDLGLTLLNLTVMSLKRRLRISKINKV